MKHMQTVGPQCNLYVPAPILQHGENVVVSTDLGETLFRWFYEYNDFV